MQSVRPDVPVRQDITSEAKQTFQVVALLATILVVGIHYKSDVPDVPSPAGASWNELTQEFVFGGLGRVAVPLFAFAAGFFYFRTDDGSLATYRRKLQQRLRTVCFPFFIIGSVALASWLLVRRLEGDPVELTAGEFLAAWLLRPPAEQLWFLRDLMLLVILSPAIRWLCERNILRRVFLATVALLWTLNWQVFPIVAGWHLLHMETLLFFALGCWAVSHTDWIERVGRAPKYVFCAGCLIWFDLIIARIFLRADFDIWYATDYGLVDLLLHQASVIVGSVALFMIAWRIRYDCMIRLSGVSFFVYLVHEFPLRAIADRFAERLLDHSTSCWIVTPTVLIGCYSAGLLLGHYFPSLLSVLTGGRTPATATSRSHPVGHVATT